MTRIKLIINGILFLTILSFLGCPPPTPVTFTITASVTGNGSVSISPNQASYESGTQVTVTAIPDTGGDTFANWSGDLSGSETEKTFAISKNMNFNARFNDSIPNWAILIHFAIDNNIDYTFETDYGIVSNYLNTLENIEDADSADNIDIFLMMDGYEGLGGNGFTDGYYHLSGGVFAGDLVVDRSSGNGINSGSVDETTAFIDWAAPQVSADQYMYSVFNHGGGFDDANTAGTYGIGFDDSHDDALSHHELGQTTAYLKSLIGKNIDLVFMYACLMGGVELAYEVKDNADYLMISEESFPADYWSYEALSDILSTPTIGPEALGQAFCDSAYTYFGPAGIDRDFTLSVIDLSTIDALAAAVDAFAAAAVSDISSSATAEDYYQTAYPCLSMVGYEVPDFYYIDLGDFMTEIGSAAFVSAAVTTATADVNAAIGNSVIYLRQHNKSRASGITIFHNIEYAFLGNYPAAWYQSILDFGTEHNWADYINQLETRINFTAADPYENDDSAAGGNILPYGTDSIPQYHTIHNTSDTDWYRLPGDTDDLYLVGFLCYDNTFEVNFYEGDISGPTGYLTTFDTSAPIALTANWDPGTYLWVEVASSLNSTGMYRASIFQYDESVLADLYFTDFGFPVNSLHN